MTLEDRRRQRRKERTELERMYPIRVGVLLGGLARAWLGETWWDSASALAANLELVYGVDALEGYLGYHGRN
jgi:hypothetical protein